MKALLGSRALIVTVILLLAGTIIPFMIDVSGEAPWNQLRGQA